MKSKLGFLIVISILIILSSCATNSNTNQTITIDDFYNRFIAHITTNLSSDYDLKFAVLSFESTKKDDTESEELGIYLAESIASKVSMNIPASTLFERENLEILLKEHDLNLSGYIDSDQAMEVGKLIPVNALLAGKYTILNDTVTINCRLIDVNTGEILIAYYDSVELSKDLSSLSGKEWEEEEQPEVAPSKSSTTNNGSLFFSSTLRVDEEILPFVSYIKIAEDNQNDFSQEGSFGTSQEPAGDIKDLYFFEDEENYYFLLNFYNNLSLQDININFYFRMFNENFDDFSVRINYPKMQIIYTFLNQPNGNGSKIEIDKNFRFRFDKVLEILVPKRVFRTIPVNLLLQTRTQQAKEIDRLEIDLGSSFSNSTPFNSNTKEAEPIIVGSKIGYKIPEKKITIDGLSRDWSNINPVYLNHSRKEGDESKLIKAVYVARDDEYLYLRMDVINDNPAKDETVYAFNVKDGELGAKDDLELGYRVMRNNGHIQFNKFLSARDWEGISVPSSFGASGKIIELKYPLTWIVNKNELILGPYIHIDELGDTDSLDEFSLFF